MEDIATAAGVTRQTVYAHFPTRNALITALIDVAGAETVAAIDAAGSTEQLEELRISLLGRKAELPNLLRGVAQLPPEERGAVGKAANVAFNRTAGSVFSRPRQFGPINRIPCLRARAVTSDCRARPSGPVSENPAVSSASDRTPRAPQPRTTSATCPAGTATTARSTGSGSSSGDATQLTPSTASYLGFTA